MLQPFRDGEGAKEDRQKFQAYIKFQKCELGGQCIKKKKIHNLETHQEWRCKSFQRYTEALFNRSKNDWFFYKNVPSQDFVIYYLLIESSDSAKWYMLNLHMMQWFLYNSKDNLEIYDLLLWGTLTNFVFRNLSLVMFK